MIILPNNALASNLPPRLVLPGHKHNLLEPSYYDEPFRKCYMSNAWGAETPIY
jgi:hypothetical protein